jgi:CelD/BcsL family acetyltransferase involved in cellulose biosynthesis
MSSGCFSRSWAGVLDLDRSGVRVVARPERLPELRTAWDGLAAGGSPMQQYAWALACAQTFADDGTLRVLALEDAGRVRAIAPFVARDGRRLETLGHGELFEPTDPISPDPASLEALLGALVRGGIPVALDRVSADATRIQAFRRACRWRGLALVRPAEPCPYLELGPAWVEPERQFNAGRRSDLRRARRHAERCGKVNLEVHAPGPDQLEPLLDDAFRVEEAGWKADCGSALAVDAKLGAFFRRYARLAASEGILRLCFLRIAGRPAAMQLAVEVSRRFWLLKIGYDEQFARCSPGTLLMLHTIRHAAERGLEAYEMLGSREPWTQWWTRAAHPHVKLRSYPCNRRGVLALTRDVVRKAASHAIRRVEAVA